MNSSVFVIRRLASLLAVMALAAAALAQGPLVPPGPPAQTMKSLQELHDAVGPRTPIVSLPFTISQPGSYVVTQSLTGAAAQNGITIAVSNVSLDLNGHTLRGTPGALHGIAIGPNVTNVTIRNGKVTHWPGDGITADYYTAHGVMVSGIVSSLNEGSGIRVNAVAVVQDCEVTSNSELGIYVIDQGHIQNCIVSYNGDNGILAQSNSIVENCIAMGNQLAGILGLFNTSIRGCVARQNGLAGILVYNNCVVLENQASYFPPPIIFAKKSIAPLPADTEGVDPFSLDGGIAIVGFFNRIESNTVTESNIGYHYYFKDNFIVKNVAMGCTKGFMQAIAPFGKAPSSAQSLQTAVTGGGDIFIAPIQTTFAALTIGPWDNFNFNEGSIIFGK